jgi:RHS repeat-associated protein
MRVARHPSRALTLSAIAVLLVSGFNVPPAAAGNGNANLHLDKSVGAVRVDPQLAMTLAVDKAEAIPGDRLTYSTTVSNTAASLVLSGDLTTTNTNATTATLASYWDAVATNDKAHCGAGGSNNGKDEAQWAPFAGTAAVETGYTPVRAAPIATGLKLAATPVAADGVTYPAADATDQILGTTLAPGATASWHYTATLPLTPAQLAFLRDPAQVTRIRNSFHAEPTPRDQQGNAQPDQVNVDFCEAFNAADTSGAARDVEVTIVLPDGTTTTVRSSDAPSLAAIPVGGTATVTVPYTVPVPPARDAAESEAAYVARLAERDGAVLSATAGARLDPTLPPLVSAGPATTTEHLPILSIAKSGPVDVEAGKTAAYDLALANHGSAYAVAPAVADALPAGTEIPVTAVPDSLAPGAAATAHASYDVPLSQPAGTLTDTASLTWQDANANPYGPLSSSATTQVKQSARIAKLVLTPDYTAPLPVGATHTFTVTATDADGNPVVGVPIHLAITGPNATSADATTDAAGMASFPYVGTMSGTDEAQASGQGASGPLNSNTATAVWVVPDNLVSTIGVHGTFYSAPLMTTAWTATPDMTPVWEQDFSSINFDPPRGSVPNSPVTDSTTPLTDVITDPAGNYLGSLPAGGNGFSPGGLTAFNTVLTDRFVVAHAGDIALDLNVDDGFFLGIGGGATRVSGIWLNPPASGLTPFHGLPVVAALNNYRGEIAASVTVHFPAPGIYPFELDYYECCGGSQSIVIHQHDANQLVGNAASLALSPLSPPVLNHDDYANFGAEALDAAGNPIVGLPVELDITGPNTQSLTSVTDATGVAYFTYRGHVMGAADTLQAHATIYRTVVYSGVATQGFYNGLNAPTISGLSLSDGQVVTSPTPVQATLAGADGSAIGSWKVTYHRNVTGAPEVTIASGSGNPASTTLATFDPTMLPNGDYTITVSAVSGMIHSGSVSTTVVVDGDLKLGRYEVTYKDADVAVGGIPIQVLRTYDSFDKTKGDFGVGWRLGVANFQLYTNGALGQGGWSQYTRSCFMAGLGGGLCQLGWKTTRAHFVTVVWPDGHTETFDLTPTDASNLFWFGGAAFTGRPGTTSKLAVDGDATVSYFGNGNLYAGLTQQNVFAPTRFKLTAKDGTVYLLDVASGLVSATDRLGNTLTIDAAGIHSSLGPSVTFSRDASGRITLLTEPDGSTVQYAYNTPGDLVTVTDERGYAVTFQYDSTHNLTKTIDPNGHPPRTLVYGPDGRLRTVTDGDGNTTTVNVDPTARTEVVTGPDPRLTTVSSMDQRGDIVQVDETFGGKTLTTKFTYDDFGNVLSKTDPSGEVTKATYDAASSPLTLTEADGGTWTFTYNDHEQLTSIEDRTGRVVATLTYDDYGELTRKTTADGDTTYTYFANGLLKTSTDPADRTTSYTYDSAGRAATVKGPDGRLWSYTYDGDGRTRTVTDPASQTTTFSYDNSGNLTGFTDAAGRGQTYTYDALGHLATATDGDRRTTTYTYDLAGQLTGVLDRNGDTTTFGYNSAGQVTLVTLPGGARVGYTYDPIGELIEADDADARLTFSYDDSGNLASQTSAGTATSDQPTVSLSIGRDAAGRPRTLTAPWGTTSFSYDANGLLASVTDPSGGDFSLGYDPLGRLTSLSRPNGVTDSYAYTAAGQLASRSSAKSGSVIDALGYTYDDSGRVATRTDSSGTTTYGYDTADRLTSVLAPAGSPVPNEAFSYDGSGNQTGAGQVYDGANRLLADARYDYVYDGEGNLTRKTERSSGAVTTYAWNALHELTSATLPDGTVVTYRYDPLGRRVEESTGTAATRFVNLGANVVAEYDGSNTLRATYLTTFGSGDLPGMPLEVSVGATSSYPLLDQVDSVTAFTDSAGSTSSNFAYSAYGVPVGASSGTYSYGTYGYDSSTGLYYARARYYDPVAGRFLSEDPVRHLNLFLYVRGDPTNASDPTGAVPNWCKALCGIGQKLALAAAIAISRSPAGGSALPSPPPEVTDTVCEWVTDSTKKKLLNESLALKDAMEDVAAEGGKVPENLLTGLGEQMGEAEKASEAYKKGQAGIQGG